MASVLDQRPHFIRVAQRSVTASQVILPPFSFWAFFRPYPSVAGKSPTTLAAPVSYFIISLIGCGT